MRRDRSINLQQQSVLACSIKFFALKKNARTRMFAAAWSSLHQRMWFYLSRLNLKQNDFPPPLIVKFRGVRESGLAGFPPNGL